MKPYLTGIFLGHPLRLNSHGFRTGEIENDKSSNTLRIAALGDSTMFGWGVKTEDRFSDLLQNQLVDAFGPAWHIEMVNLGVPAYNSAQEAELFETERGWVKPDAVIIHYDPNDIYSMFKFFCLDRSCKT